jgi:large subunit ribosomal protein L13e
MKHNQVIANAHFHKNWANHVQTWFDQPADKQKRRNARIIKAKRVAPRPVNLLRPIVRCPTIKYNMKIRAGRGFTFAELKAAEINKKQARGVGIAVDHRRENRSEESFQANVQRLKLYKSKLVVFPRRSTKRLRAGDSTKERRSAAVQVLSKSTLPIQVPEVEVQARKITKEEKDTDVYARVRKARTDQKRAGARTKRAADKLANAAAGAKKENKNDDLAD